MKSRLANQSPISKWLVGLMGLASVSAGYFISTTYYNEQQALMHDATVYWQMAHEFQSSGWPNPFSGQHWYMDVGYPLMLSIVLTVFGDSFRVAQVANVFMLAMTGLLSFLSVRKLMEYLGQPLRYWWQYGLAGAFFCSPCLITFSGKVYSEIFAALGLSMILLAILYLWDGHERVFSLSVLSWMTVFLCGTIIFFATKSAFIPLLGLYIVGFVLLRKRMLLIISVVGLLIVIPFQIIAQHGGRGPSNFAHQVAKIEVGWTYSEIAKDGIYNFSNTLGQMAFPEDERQFMQNPSGIGIIGTPGFERNPYIRAGSMRADGFSYSDGIQLIVKDPVRYAVVVMASLPAMLAPEGIYPEVSNNMPKIPKTILWLSLKICLGVALWLGTIVLFIHQKRNPLLIIYGAPIVVFILVYGNFNIEQRWLFPLLPLLWTLALCQLLLWLHKRGIAHA